MLEPYRYLCGVAQRCRQLEHPSSYNYWSICFLTAFADVCRCFCPPSLFKSSVSLVPIGISAALRGFTSRQRFFRDHRWTADQLTRDNTTVRHKFNWTQSQKLNSSLNSTGTEPAGCCSARSRAYPNGAIFAVADHQLALRMEDDAGHVVRVARHGVHLPSLRLVHAPQLHLRQGTESFTGTCNGIEHATENLMERNVTGNVSGTKSSAECFVERNLSRKISTESFTKRFVRRPGGAIKGVLSSDKRENAHVTYVRLQHKQKNYR